MSTYRPSDFYSETPPPRIIGTETENIIAHDSNINELYAKILYRSKSRYGGSREDQYMANGGRIHQDGSALEFATPESLGPMEAACADIAGQLIVASTAKVIFENRESIYRSTGGYSNEGLKSVGYHQNLLTTTYSSERVQRNDARIMGAYLATRVIWSGSGLLKRSGFTFSQKAHDIKSRDHKPEVQANLDNHVLGIGAHLNRTQAGEKPLLTWSAPGSGSMESHAGNNWQRLEIRHADSTHSPWARFMGLATASLVLRLMEHKQHFPGFNWNDLMLDTLAAEVAPISNDLSMKHIVTTKSGLHTTAIAHQRQLAIMSLELASQIELPNDEIYAANEWLKICEDLQDIDIQNPDTLDLIRDRVEWSARLWALQHTARKLGGVSLDASHPRLAGTDILWDQIHPRSTLESYWKKHQTEFYTKHEVQIESLLRKPPQFTRAARRSWAISKGYRIQPGIWDRYSIPGGGGQTVRMPDPYNFSS